MKAAASFAPSSGVYRIDLRETVNPRFAVNALRPAAPAGIRLAVNGAIGGDGHLRLLERSYDAGTALYTIKLYRHSSERDAIVLGATLLFEVVPDREEGTYQARQVGSIQGSIPAAAAAWFKNLR